MSEPMSREKIEAFAVRPETTAYRLRETALAALDREERLRERAKELEEALAGDVLDGVTRVDRLIVERDVLLQENREMAKALGLHPDNHTLAQIRRVAIDLFREYRQEEESRE